MTAYHLAHGGVSRYEKFRHYETTVLHKPPLDAAREQMLAERFAALVVEGVLTAPLVAGITNVLDCYRGKVPMLVISGTPQDELRRIVLQHGLNDYFIEVHGSPKDKTSHIADILVRYGYARDRTLMIGDALTDFEAADANSIGFLGRVPAGHANPFPAGTSVLTDFSACVGGELDNCS